MVNVVDKVYPGLVFEDKVNPGLVFIDSYSKHAFS